MIARVIDMPPEVAAKSEQYRQGFTAYHMGKPKNANPFVDDGSSRHFAHYESEWNEGWEFACDLHMPHLARGKIITLPVKAQDPVPLALFNHIKERVKFDDMAQAIWTVLEKEDAFDDNCPHSGTFEEFGTFENGHINLRGSTFWGGEDHSRYFQVPLEWFESTPDVATIQEYVAKYKANLAEIKQREAITKANAEAEAKRQKDLTKLRELMKEYPVEAEIARVYQD